MKTKNGPLTNLTSNGEFRKDTEENQVRRKFCALYSSKKKGSGRSTRLLQRKFRYSSTAACGRKFSTLGSQRSD